MLKLRPHDPPYSVGRTWHTRLNTTSCPPSHLGHLLFLQFVELASSSPTDSSTSPTQALDYSARHRHRYHTLGSTLTRLPTISSSRSAPKPIPPIVPTKHQYQSKCAITLNGNTRAATSAGSRPSGAETTRSPTSAANQTSPTLSTGRRSYAVCDRHDFHLEMKNRFWPPTPFPVSSS